MDARGHGRVIHGMIPHQLLQPLLVESDFNCCCFRRGEDFASEDGKLSQSVSHKHSGRGSGCAYDGDEVKCGAAITIPR